MNARSVLKKILFAQSVAAEKQVIYDSHRTAIPVNAFLRELNVATKGRSDKVYWKSFAKADGDPKFFSNYRCNLVRNAGKIIADAVSRIAQYSRIFELLRGDLSGPDLAAFQRLWTKYGLDAYLGLMNKSSLAAAAAALWNSDNFMRFTFSQNDPCSDEIQNLKRYFDSDLLQCRVSCEKDRN